MRIQPKKGIIIAFGELFLKSPGVKSLFAKRLAYNLEFFLKKNKVVFSLIQSHDRIFIKTEDIAAAKKVIKNVFGISWFSECYFFQQAKLGEFSAFIKENYADWIKSKETFALRVKVEPGVIKEKKEKIIVAIASGIDRKVDLTNPKKELCVEVRRSGWLLYFKKNKRR